jgi:hypothetical protein
MTRLRWLGLILTLERGGVSGLCLSAVISGVLLKLIEDLKTYKKPVQGSSNAGSNTNRKDESIAVKPSVTLGTL